MAEAHTEVVDAPRDPEREARRRLALAQLRQYGDPVLRMRAREVEEFDADLRRLAERMMHLMDEAVGLGLAANQVGVLQRIFIVRTGEDEEPFAVVNPVIVPRDDEVETEDEGCLSLPNVLVPVERSVRVQLQARDLDGRELELDLEGLGARVVQHELDHLDGILMLDRTTKDARREALAVLRPRVVLESS